MFSFARGPLLGIVLFALGRGRLMALVVPLLLILLFVISCERPALGNAVEFCATAVLGTGAVLGLRLWNRARERECELYFEEKPEEPLITLGLRVNPRARM